MSRDCKLKGASYMHQRQLWAIWRQKGDKELAMTLIATNGQQTAASAPLGPYRLD